MEEFVGPRFDGVGNTIRKKRTQISRRPRPDSQTIPENHDFSPSSSTPPSDDASKVSSNENAGFSPSPRRNGFNLNQCVSRVAFSGEVEGGNAHKKIVGSGGRLNGEYENIGNSERKRCSEGVLAPANWKSTSESSSVTGISGRTDEHQSLAQPGMSFDGLGNESKVKKVKLKVGGVTRTIQANPTTNDAMWGRSSSKTCMSSDMSHQQQRLNFRDNSDDNHSPPNKKSGLQGIPWKDFAVGFNLRKEDSSMGKIKPGDKSEPVRKSKRVPKKRIMDGSFDDDDDDEIRYLEKLKTSKLVSRYKDDEEEPIRKHRSVSKIVDLKADENLKRLGKDKKNPNSDEDMDYEGEDDLASYCELEDKKKERRKESIQTLMEGKKEMGLTTRQRALQSGKDASTANTVEFPNGLPPAPSRRQKEKLTDVEQQLKKAEAAQRRRVQVEKAARESEAEAIRKILGQDSSRKKREDKLKKRREELAQEKAASALVLASNTIRWVTGPTGTIVTFSNDMGFPSIFDPKPYSYPPPRENCAGPSCTNPYKYRDSKSKLPLCSLQCYKAIQG